MKQRMSGWLRENWLLSVVIALLVIGYLTLSQRPTATGSSSEFIASLSQGTPTIISFYSNF